ncbi:MAG TPA: histidinol dehydrogenase [Bacteroidales bacterium]|jgi:histidinol dehydrogenase|nr:histidinol dehydrogenase [Bacteroidales bacterium]
MEILVNPSKQEWKSALQRPLIENKQLETTVQEIMEQVKNNGDAAVLRYSQQFDNPNVNKLEVSFAEIEAAQHSISPDLKHAIVTAIKNIQTFHERQEEIPSVTETMYGVKCWRKSVPIEKVGLYIPGGSAPLFSTILMLAIPAKIAGCKEIIVCTPESKQGGIHPAILYAAQQAGVTKIFRIGGAQAIAAMAYGTETIPQVYKIFGPGNQFVTKAKMMAAMQGIAIDMPAGPSEVMVIADDTAEPAFIAADLLSQCEHGADSQSILVTNSMTIAHKTKEEVDKQLSQLTRKELASSSLQHSKIIVFDDMNHAVELMNEYAPEHLILSVQAPFQFSKKVINAGSVFLGNYSPESAGDYASGTNHTLPTNGYAKAYSGVSLDSFVKKITFQEITQEGLQTLGPIIETMAAAEMLDAHKNAVRIRLNSIS